MDCVGIVLKGVRKIKLCFETTRDLESWFCCVFYAICLCNSENVLVTLICRGSVMFLMAWQVGENPYNGERCLLLPILVYVLCARNCNWNFSPLVLDLKLMMIC